MHQLTLGGSNMERCRKATSRALKVNESTCTHMKCTFSGIQNGGSLWVFMLQTKVLEMLQKSIYSGSFPSNLACNFINWFLSGVFQGKSCWGGPMHGHLFTFFKLLMSKVLFLYLFYLLFFFIFSNNPLKFPKIPKFQIYLSIHSFNFFLNTISKIIF